MSTHGQFPQRVWGPGEYVGPPVWVPPEATSVALELTGRDAWQAVGLAPDVVTLALEINTDGSWRELGACTTDTTPKVGRDGTVRASTALRVRLPRVTIPQPQVRGCLACRSRCQAAGTLTFDVTPRAPAPVQAHYSVTYNNDNEAVAANATSVTISSFVVGNNANRVLLVGHAAWDSTAGDSLIAGVTWNGSATGWASVLTRLITSGTDRASLWRLIAPTATTASVVVTATATTAEFGANVLSAYDVHQTTPLGTAVGGDGLATPATVTVGSVGVDDLLYDTTYYSSSAVSATVGADQTSRAVGTLSGFSQILVSTQPGTAGGVMSWTLGGSSVEWVQCAVAIKPAPAAATKAPLPRRRPWRFVRRT